MLILTEKMRAKTEKHFYGSQMLQRERRPSPFDLESSQVPGKPSKVRKDALVHLFMVRVKIPWLCLYSVQHSISGFRIWNFGLRIYAGNSGLRITKFC